ncbi:MAG: choice-of-anchor Q domain-containing protein [Sporichthyaceae bacterium]
MSNQTLPRERGSGLPRGTRGLALGSAGVLCASLGVVLAATPASAVDTALFVSPSGTASSNCTASSPCSFVGRALTVANGRPAGENITVNVAAGIYTESATSSEGLLIALTNSPASLTIRGAAANQTTIRPGNDRRVVRVTGGFPVRFEGVTLTGGSLPTAAAAMPGAAGGGVLLTGSGPLTIAKSVVTSNRAGTGASGSGGEDGDNGSSSGTAAAANGANAPTTGPDAPTAGAAGGQGGGIAVTGTADLTIIDSTVSGNTAGSGGTGGNGGEGGDGARNTVMPASGTGGNGAPGAAGGAGGAGGGIAFAGGTLTITNSTIANNTAGTGGVGGAGGKGGSGADGNAVVKPAGAGGNGAGGGTAGAAGDIGAITVTAGRATLTHATVAGNSGGFAAATSAGGAAGTNGTPFAGNLLDPVPGPPVVAVPTAGGPGVAGAVSTVNGMSLTAPGISLEVRNSLVANQAGARANCAGGVTSALTTASDGTCAGATANAAVASNLTALTDNGGTTTTIGFTGVNPAINSVPVASCLPTDQRNLARPGFTGATTCTAGAFEPQMPTNPSNPTITATETSAIPKSAFGFYRSDVRVTFTCTPGATPGSGTIVECPSALTLSGNGLNQGGTFTTRDSLGRTASVMVAVGIDKNLPTLKFRGAKQGKTYNNPRDIRCIASDAISGLDGTCSLDETERRVGSKRQFVEVRYTSSAKDRAGNVRTKSGSYRYKR